MGGMLGLGAVAAPAVPELEFNLHRREVMPMRTAFRSGLPFTLIELLGARPSA